MVLAGLREEIESIQRDAEALARRLAKLMSRLEAIDRILHEDITTIEPTLPSTPVPIPVPPPPPPAEHEDTPVGNPDEREIPGEIIDEVVKQATRYGVDPGVLFAIEVHETGWYTSETWAQRRNPGGMKNAPKSFTTEQVATTRDPKKPTYLVFSSWREGIRGHAVFLGLGDRYDTAMRQTTPSAMIQAIFEAGYAEDPEWPLAIKTLHGQVVDLVRPTPRPSPLAAIIELSRTPFPYAPETKGGTLGCANVISAALVKAGVLPAILLGVREVEAALTTRGWSKWPPETVTIADDMVVWEEIMGSDGELHPHIGICDGTGAAWQNSGEEKRITRIELGSYARPIEAIYRKGTD